MVLRSANSKLKKQIAFNSQERGGQQPTPEAEGPTQGPYAGALGKVSISREAVVDFQKTNFCFCLCLPTPHTTTIRKKKIWSAVRCYGARERRNQFSIKNMPSDTSTHTIKNSQQFSPIRNVFWIHFLLTCFQRVSCWPILFSLIKRMPLLN